MAVIDLGRVVTHVKNVTCKNCSHLLEYVEADVLEFWVSDYGGGSDRVRYIPCPICSREGKHHKVLVK